MSQHINIYIYIYIYIYILLICVNGFSDYYIINNTDRDYYKVIKQK